MSPYEKTVTKKKTHGKKIIEFCRTYDFLILNGRSRGDPCGNYTHLNFNNGPSAVDYAICNENAYEMIDNFLLLPLNELSDHSKIVTIFKAPSLKDASQSDDYKWKPRGILYKWDANNAQNFIKTLTASTEEIKEISQRIEAGLVHSTGEKIQQLFINAAKISLKNKNKNITKNWKKRKKNKKMV